MWGQGWLEKKSNWRIILEILELCNSKYVLLFSKTKFSMFFCLEDTNLFVLYARIKVECPGFTEN